MKESWQTKIYKLFFNIFPAYRGTGGRVVYIAADWREMRIKLPLNWRTRNYVGTIFGGSIYGSVDPIYMLMLIKILGDKYTVWDKSAAIQFLKPGRTTLYATFHLPESETAEVQRLLKSSPSVDRFYTVHLKDKNGSIYATVEKTIYISKSK